jgi:hypothetical protein
MQGCFGVFLFMVGCLFIGNVVSSALGFGVFIAGTGLLLVLTENDNNGGDDDGKTRLIPG